MLRILFLVLWLIPVLGPQARGAIEIYANGRKYASLQAYLASKESAKARIPPTPASLDSQQKEYIRKEAQELGIKVDFSKVKTLQVSQKKLSDIALHKLYVLSVERGVVGALQDFYGGRAQFDFPMARRIYPEQLQRAIQQAVTRSKNPELLISEPGKVRIMALTARDLDKI